MLIYGVQWVFFAWTEQTASKSRSVQCWHKSRELARGGRIVGHFFTIEWWCHVPMEKTVSSILEGTRRMLHRISLLKSYLLGKTKAWTLIFYPPPTRRATMTVGPSIRNNWPDPIGLLIWTKLKHICWKSKYFSGPFQRFRYFSFPIEAKPLPWDLQVAWISLEYDEQKS